MFKILKSFGLISSLLVGACTTTGGYEDKDFVIRGDTGGVVDLYKMRARKIHEDGRRVVVDGECSSACLFYLSSYSSGRYCATPRARIGFHAIYYVDRKWEIIRNEEVKEKAVTATKELLDALHPKLRNRYLTSGYPSVYSGASPTKLEIIAGEEAVKLLGKC